MTVRPDAPALSPRLEQLLDLAIKGVPDKAIASELGIGPHTVDSSWRRLRVSFGAANRAETIALHIERREARRISNLCARVEALESEAYALREANARLSSALETRDASVIQRFEASARFALTDAKERDRLHRIVEAIESSDTFLYEGEIGGLWRKYWATENVSRLGFSANSFVDGETRIADLIPAQDMLALMITFEHALAEGAKDFVVFYRVRLPDGHHRWVRDHMTIERNEAGEPIRYFGCATDVTDIAAHCDPALLMYPSVQ